MNKKKHLIIGSAIFSGIAVISLFAMLPLTAKSSTSKGSGWMKNLDDSTTLTSMSIPGSHDSGALHSIGDLSGKCQDLAIADQLNAGVRFFDIRLQLRDDELKVVHGIVDQKLDFSNVLNDFKAFLNNHPAEGLIVSIKKESQDKNSSITFEEGLKKQLANYSNLWNLGRNLPETLGQIRGKIYLVSRYKDNSIGLPAYDGWIEHDADAVTNTFDIVESNLHIQDYFKIKDIEMKKKEILSCFEYSKNNLDSLTLNFTSCYFLNSFPPTYAGSTAKIINNWVSEQIKNEKNLGVIVSDFVTSDFCEQIYKRN